MLAWGVCAVAMAHWKTVDGGPREAPLPPILQTKG